MTTTKPDLRFLVLVDSVNGVAHVAPVWVYESAPFVFLTPALVAEAPEPDAPAVVREFCPDAVFLNLFDRVCAAGRNLSAKPRAGNYAPGVLCDLTTLKQSRDALADAMERLLAAGVLVEEAYGRPSRRAWRLARATPLGLFD